MFLVTLTEPYSSSYILIYYEKHYWYEAPSLSLMWSDVMLSNYPKGQLWNINTSLRRHYALRVLYYLNCGFLWWLKERIWFAFKRWYNYVLVRQLCPAQIGLRNHQKSKIPLISLQSSCKYFLSLLYTILYFEVYFLPLFLWTVARQTNCICFVHREYSAYIRVYTLCQCTLYSIM